MWVWENAESECITNSDHSVVIARLGTGIIDKRKPLAREKRLKGRKRIILTDKAQEEEWENYKTKLNEEIIKRLKTKNKMQDVEKRCKELDKNALWDIIASSILSSAYVTLPNKKVSANTRPIGSYNKNNGTQHDLKILGKWCHKCHEKTNTAHEAKKLGISFQERSLDKDALEIEGTSIRGIITEKELHSYKKSTSLNIFILEQLLTREGDKLITWKQLRKIRGLKKRGRKPSWFKSIELEVLTESSSREIKGKYKVAAPNQQAIAYNYVRISQDRRKREWIVFEKDKSIEIGKVIKKKRKCIDVEHWQIIKENREGDTIIEKCKGCSVKESQEGCCTIRQKQEYKHQVIDCIGSKEGTTCIGIPLSACAEVFEGSGGNPCKESEIIAINIEGIEETIIRREIKDAGI
ncbi:1425_t:CDS:2, partial [Dentiscutata heterogama]